MLPFTARSVLTLPPYPSPRLLQDLQSHIVLLRNYRVIDGIYVCTAGPRHLTFVDQRGIIGIGRRDVLGRHPTPNLFESCTSMPHRICMSGGRAWLSRRPPPPRLRRARTAPRRVDFSSRTMPSVRSQSPRRVARFVGGSLPRTVSLRKSSEHRSAGTPQRTHTAASHSTASRGYLVQQRCGVQASRSFSISRTFRIVLRHSSLRIEKRRGHN